MTHVHTVLRQPLGHRRRITQIKREEIPTLLVAPREHDAVAVRRPGRISIRLGVVRKSFLPRAVPACHVEILLTAPRRRVRNPPSVRRPDR